MKFLQMRAAIEKATKPVVKSSPPTKEEPEPAFYSPFPTKQKVLTDKISRDPIDRLAAIVTSKTPKWAILQDYGTKISNDNRTVRHPKKAARHHKKRAKVGAHANVEASQEDADKPEKERNSSQVSADKPQATEISQPELMKMLLHGAITVEEYAYFSKCTVAK